MTRSWTRSVRSWNCVGRDGRAAEVDEPDDAVGQDDGGRIDLLMGDLCLVEERERTPRSEQERIVDPRRRRSAAASASPRRTSSASSSIVAAAVTTSRVARPARSGEERDERLVLGRLQAAESERHAAAAVPDASPEGGDELVVVGVAPVDLHEQRPAGIVDAAHVEDARDLLLGDLEPRGRHTELGESRLDVVEAGSPGRGATGEPAPAAAATTR